MSEVIDFPNASQRGRTLRRPGVRNGPNMRTLLFRSYDVIVELDEADLIRDVGFAIDRAQTKLKRLQRRLKNVREQAAANVQLLTTAETKLTAAIVAALLSSTDETPTPISESVTASGLPLTQDG